jgi:hypothetical protein
MWTSLDVEVRTSSHEGCESMGDVSSLMRWLTLFGQAATLFAPLGQSNGRSLLKLLSSKPLADVTKAGGATRWRAAHRSAASQWWRTSRSVAITCGGSMRRLCGGANDSQWAGAGCCSRVC